MLVIKNLEKSYGSFKAVKGLNLEIKKGEIFGFIGPNGAGKSTTMKIISGLLSPDSGEVYVDGVDAIKNNKALKDKIGYMPDFFGVYDNLKAIEYLEFYASIYGIVGKEARELSMDLLRLVNLEDKYDAYVDGLSRGMKQRLCLARCLVHNPDLLILDEPASGMDPRARYEMKGILRTVEEIMTRAAGASPIVFTVLSKEEEAIKLLKELPYVDNIKIDGNKITANVIGNDGDVANLLKYLVLKDIPVLNYSRAVGNLEDVFIQITADSDEEGA